MNRQASNSWNHFGVRGSDGVLEALPLRTCIYRSDWLEKTGFDFRQNPMDGKQLFRVEWCTLNLKRGEFSETLSTMPPEARKYGASVACGNRIYVLGGECSGDIFCPDGKFNNVHFHNCVFYFDSARPNCGWKRGPAMLVSRETPSAVAAGGKIYVFGSTRLSEGYFAEVFSVELGRWDLLPEPPVASGLVPESVSDHVLLDASRSRILVHFKSNNSLQAFHFHADGGSWECVDPEFGLWSQASVIVGDFAFFYFDFGVDWAEQCIIAFGAYHLVHKKWFPVKWLSEPRLIAAPFSHLFHLGNGRLCLFSHFDGMDCLEYLTIRVHLDSASGEIHAIAEPESVIAVPFPHFSCQVLEL
ncbi:hypothetical protein V6N13_013586 [Hibiscus sabdariffa]